MTTAAFVYRHLLITVAATILFSQSPHAMPLSWSTSAGHQRSRRDATDRHTLPTPAGTVNQNPVDVPTGSTSGGGDMGSDNSNACANCPNRPVPTEEQIGDLMQELWTEPHPMFLLSERAEKLHQKRFCERANGICDNPQVEKTVKDSVINNITSYLNSNLDPSNPCSPSYTIDYFPDRYPRYLVQVNCNLAHAHIHKVGPMHYLQLNEESSIWVRTTYPDVALGCICPSCVNN